MNIKKGDCEICGGWVGIQNNFGINGHIKCGKCDFEKREYPTQDYRNVP